MVIGVEQAAAQLGGLLSGEQHGVVADAQSARPINTGIQATSVAALVTHALVIAVGKPASILKTRDA